MKYLEKSFSIAAPSTDEYRNGWERVFGKKIDPAEVDERGICDHCRKRNLDLYSKGGLFLCAACAGLPPKVPAFWTCPDCGGTAAWGQEQLHRCPRSP